MCVIVLSIAVRRIQTPRQFLPLSSLNQVQQRLEQNSWKLASDSVSQGVVRAEPVMKQKHLKLLR
jgi:hypothetical protein